jgi:hypothetical protein
MRTEREMISKEEFSFVAPIIRCPRFPRVQEMCPAEFIETVESSTKRTTFGGLLYG